MKRTDKNLENQKLREALRFIEGFAEIANKRGIDFVGQVKIQHPNGFEVARLHSPKTTSDSSATKKENAETKNGEIK